MPQQTKTTVGYAEALMQNMRARGFAQAAHWNPTHVKIIAFMLALMAIEAAFSKTALVTGIAPGIKWGMILAAALAYPWLLKVSWKAITSRPPFKAVLLSLGALMAVAIYFAIAAFRIANHWEFAFSRAPWTMVWHEIADTDCGCQRHADFQTASVTIFPYNRKIMKIPVPDKQFEALDDNSQGMCVAVRQRQSPSGAIQIANTGDHRLTEPKWADIRPCGDVTIG